jgi:hypothetical protein
MELKIRRMPPPPAPASRPILRQEHPGLGPHHNPPPATPQTASNATAAHALSVARNPGSIDSRKQRF